MQMVLYLTHICYYFTLTLFAYNSSSSGGKRGEVAEEEKERRRRRKNSNGALFDPYSQSSSSPH